MEINESSGIEAGNHFDFLDRIFTGFCFLCMKKSLNILIHCGSYSQGKSSVTDRPNRLRFALPISTHVTIPLGSLSIVLLFAHMAQLCMVRNM